MAPDEKNSFETEEPVTITESLINHAGSIAKNCGASAILVYYDAVGGEILSPEQVYGRKVFYIVKNAEEENSVKDAGFNYFKVPDVRLTRIGQIKIAVFIALSRGLIEKGDKIVSLTGISSSGTLDTILVTEVGKEFEIVSTGNSESELENILPEVVERVIELATDLGKEGREGRTIGSIFVIGDTENVIPLTKQLILNPFRGYEAKERNILDQDLGETIKELATIDGAFIIRGSGLIESCGTYLKTLSYGDYELPRGLGARHHAAAGITAVTNSMAVTVSESTGTVSIFKGGKIITEIEKPRSLPPEK